MARRTRRRRPGRDNNLLVSSFAIGVFSCVVAGIGTLAYSIYRNYEDRIGADPKSGCVSKMPRDHHTILMIDATDPFGIRQRRTLLGQGRQNRALWESIWDSLRPNERFSAVLITDRMPSSLPNLVSETELCRMYKNRDEIAELGIPIGISTAEDAYLSRIYTEFRSHSVQPVFNQLAKVVESSETSADSPILEYISELSKWSGFRQQHRRLVIVSDMLQNSVGFPMVQNATVNYSNFKDAPYAKRLLPDSLNDVEVKIYYVARNQFANIQTESHRKFWHDYFVAAGARWSEYTVFSDDTGQAIPNSLQSTPGVRVP